MQSSVSVIRQVPAAHLCPAVGRPLATSAARHPGRVGVRALLTFQHVTPTLRVFSSSSKGPVDSSSNKRNAPSATTSSLKVNDSLVVSEAEPSTGIEPRKGNKMTAKVLADLTEKGEIHDETLQAMEESEEWREYEAEVQFEMGMMRSRYAADGEQMTSQRRSQMQAHLRQVQKKVMNEHAEKAARKFVEGVTAEEVRLLRRILTRIDGLPTNSDGGKALLDIGTVKTVDGQELKHALWQLSEELGKAEPELRRTLRGMLGNGIAQPPPTALPAGPGQEQNPQQLEAESVTSRDGKAARPSR